MRLGVVLGGGGIVGGVGAAVNGIQQVAWGRWLQGAFLAASGLRSRGGSFGWRREGCTVLSGGLGVGVGT